MRRNVFVIGLNEANRRKLGGIRHANACAFHGLLGNEEVEHLEHYRLDDMLDRARRQLRRFDGPVDAIVNYIDFPGNSMAAILTAELGLRGPSLVSVLKCEHKYWSRVEQRRAVPQAVPRFAWFDPFDDAALDRIDLDFPFWIKPVRAFGSYLGFRVDSPARFRDCVDRIRADIGRLGDPFDALLRRVDLPPEVAPVGGRSCIAEEIVGGRQCTVEGFVFDGDVRFHGIVDSIRYPNRTSFARYQYPSQLPGPVRAEMLALSRRVIAQVGLNNSGFNIEYFHDSGENTIRLLEINPRISQSHADLFEKVDGASNHQIIVQVALGIEPDFPHREGPFRHAAKVYLRRFEDAVVTRVPDADEVAAAERAVPGVTVRIHAREGEPLSAHRYQDSYSYVLAMLFVGADSQRALMRKARQCAERLPFAFAPVTAEAPQPAEQRA